MSLQDKLDALKTKFETEMAPPDVVAVMHRVTDELIASGQAGRALHAGDRAPVFALPDPDGKLVSSQDLLARGPLVLTFYRGAWCPYCNLALRAYQNDLVPALDQRGVALIAISPQKPDGSLSMQEKNELSFTVLSDPGNQVAAALGVLTAPTDDARGAQRVIGIALTELNDDGTPGIPMPTVAVVDAAGIINWIDVHPNYTTRTEVADIISALATFG